MLMSEEEPTAEEQRQIFLRGVGIPPAPIPTEEEMTKIVINPIPPIELAPEGESEDE
jgi:hypothetical protein